MDGYQIKNMIIDDALYSQESITVDFTHENKIYSIIYNKSDLEVVNSWVFDGGRSIPAALPEEVIDSIRKDVKNKID